MSYTQSEPFELNTGRRIAVIVTGIIGTVSTLSVSLLLLHLFSVSFISGRTNANKDERIFLRMHLGAFVVCLLLSDFIQGITGIIQLVWASRGRVTDGPLCTAQAAMLLFGDNGTAFWNVVISIHTFWTVVLGKRMSTVAVAFLIATGWTLCVILTVIGPLAIQTPAKGPFYSIAGGWCFVTGKYKDSRIYLHYLPMFISGGIITILYALVALVLFGVLVVDGTKWRFKAPVRKDGSNFFKDLVGQFSWGRIHRSNNQSSNPTGATQSTSEPSTGAIPAGNGFGLRSITGRIPSSIRLGSVGRKSTEGKERPIYDEHANVIDIGSVDVNVHQAELSSFSTPENTERGRSSGTKTIGGTHYQKEGRLVRQPTTAHHAATQASMNPNQVSGKGVQLKALAVKMLWYPAIYLVLIMPIAIARVDSTLNVSLNVMLAFMCLLWLMGTANTIIYVCTRRLGPTPWHRRSASNSKSRTRSKSSRPEQSTHRGTQHTRGPSNAVGITTINGNHTGTLPIQIQIDKYTHATDDKFFDLAKERRESSNRSSFTGADVPAAPTAAFSAYDSKPAAAFDSTRFAFEHKRSFEGARPQTQPQIVDRPQHTRAESFNSTFAPVRRESTVAFDFSDVPTGTRHAIRQGSISSSRGAGTIVPSAPGVIVQTYPRPPKPPFYQNPQDSASFSYQPPTTTAATTQPVIPPVEQQQVHEYEEEPHPYSSPSQRVRPLPPTPEPTSISKGTRVHEHRLDSGAYNSYYYDDTDDDVSPRSADFGNVATTSAHHSRTGSRA
ncbi:hypothetical protein CPB86DRAFT_18849 [Serendipita vermifera]|nr:hypothetical protein CPB86DRAFT_18849 [Serendipita vermifera]